MPPKAARGSREALVATIDGARRVALVAGSKPHRFTSLWAVVVDRRVFVRSWSVKPRSWYYTRDMTGRKSRATTTELVLG